MVAPFASTQRIVSNAARTLDDSSVPGFARTNRITYKPSTLLPWADPYIAGLVRRLQSEVRFERAAAPAGQAARAQAACVAVGAYADMEPPTPSMDADWDGWDQPRWSIDGAPTE